MKGEKRKILPSKENKIEVMHQGALKIAPIGKAASTDFLPTLYYTFSM